MNQVDETVEVLKKKIDECDELLLEISQLRYRLSTILNLMDHEPDKQTLKRRHKQPSNGIVA